MTAEYRLELRLEREATHQQAIAADLANAERDIPIRARFHTYLVEHEGFAPQTAPAPGGYYPGTHAQMLWECWLAAALAERELAAPAWTPVSERLPEPGVIVLACYTNSHQHPRRIRAKWVPAKTVESSADSDFGEYDDATDTYHDPQGWYECIDNWCDYSAVLVSEGEPTHWTPLPPAPGGTS